MKAIQGSASKGDPVLYIDEYAKVFRAFYWGNLKNLGVNKPIGYNYVLVQDDIYLSIERFQDLFSKTTGSLIDDKDIFLLSDERALFSYSSSNERKVFKKCEWIRNRSTHFERWSSNQRYFRKDPVHYYETRYFESLRYGLERYRFVYSALFIFAKGRSFSKIVGYPMLFGRESLLTSFDSFAAYRRDMAILDDYQYKRNKYRFMYLAMTQQQYAALEKPLQKEVQRSKKVFFESGKFITTLLISLITIGIALFATIGQIRKLESQNSVLNAVQRDKDSVIQSLQLSLDQKNAVIRSLDLQVQQLQLESKYLSVKELQNLLRELRK